jgi:hypothetical protein
MTAPRFPLGRIVATAQALESIHAAGESPWRLLRRHAHGDWGDLHPDDVLSNERALRRGLRVLSAYALRTGQHVWIITAGDRSLTAVMLAEEYRTRVGS